MDFVKNVIEKDTEYMEKGILNNRCNDRNFIRKAAN